MTTPGRDLETFAQELAPLLPGPPWRAEYTRYTQYEDQFPYAVGLWDTNHLSAAMADLVLEDGAVLIQEAAGTRLYLIRRPRHPDQFLIGAYAPEVFGVDAFTNVDAPDGIAVPDDAPTAADAVAQDLLLRYQAALAQVRRAHAGQAPDEVTLTWYADGALAARAASARAMNVLNANGFHYNTDERAYLRSDTDPASQARLVQKLGAQLNQHGIGLSMRHPPETALPEFKPATPPARTAIPTARRR
ncbi:hypothetical protein ACQPZG_31660 [Streptomyces sp. CA-294286]|uniref:hypothetical protein n=1 Tax=Streptomyces sp. CA-294286 TaxID=3240070 RepID=UPI003D8CE347